MGSCSENILKQSFGGVYSNELLAEGGRLYSERPEPFSYISVEVCARICLALDLFVAACPPPVHGFFISFVFISSGSCTHCSGHERCRRQTST